MSLSFGTWTYCLVSVLKNIFCITQSFTSNIIQLVYILLVLVQFLLCLDDSVFSQLLLSNAQFYTQYLLLSQLRLIFISISILRMIFSILMLILSEFYSSFSINFLADLALSISNRFNIFT